MLCNDDAVQRLRNVLSMGQREPDEQVAMTAVYGSGGLRQSAKLTWGDLRALAERLGV